MPIAADDRKMGTDFLPPLPLVEEAMKGIQRPWHLALGFPPEIEAGFERISKQDRIGRFYLAMIVGALIYDAFLLLDYFCMKSNFATCLTIRLGVSTPIALLTCLAVKYSSPGLREVLFLVPGLTAVISVLYLYRGNTALIADSQLGLTVIMTYSITATRPRFKYACAIVPLWVLGDFIYLAKGSLLDTSMVVSFSSLVWGAVCVSLLANYWMERQDRYGFLLLLRNEHKNVELAQVNDQLAKVNAELAQISKIDPLTGIPNRRFFDVEFKNAWELALQTKQPLSVLMFDLDHFKQINDVHGHDYGDTVLVLVARTIRETLRNANDIVARYGGEEFIALLPNQYLSQAIVIAERLCEAVRSIQLPPGRGEMEVRISTCIGTASIIPSTGISRTGLLRAADAALYEAKNEGRNRVRPILFENL
jgi:diguanylate cyclase (GGDEF)-like protein